MGKLFMLSPSLALCVYYSLTIYFIKQKENHYYQYSPILLDANPTLFNVA